MTRVFLLILVAMAFSVEAAPSSIKSLGLPEAPENRYNLEQVEEDMPEELVWYRYYTFFMLESKPVKHGLWIERSRSRDRERHATDFVELRKIYYQGEESTHSVESIWVGGVLRERHYIVSEDSRITLLYNAEGQEIMGPKANARGGRAKRERIVRIFNDVYELTN